MSGQAGHILIVDDDPAICEMVSDYLTGEGFNVREACDGQEMRSVNLDHWADLVLLDLKLPDEDGFALARELAQQSPEVGVLIISGKEDIVDRVTGLEIGADDYLVKPFHLREMLARVRSILRRKGNVIPADGAGITDNDTRLRGEIYHFDNWVLDTSFRTLKSTTRGEVELTSGEFDLLRVFVEHPHRPLSRDQLLNQARHREAISTDRSIDVLVGRLRRKIEVSPKRPNLIRTVRSVGYVFATDVKRG